jgi:thiosulfate dehydrogenase
MGRLISAANYIHSNMPNGTSRTSLPICRGSLGCRSLCGLHEPAAKGRSRQAFAGAIGKARRCRIRPYADDFSESQHKFGPFQSIRDKLSAMKKMSTPTGSMKPPVH